MSMVMVGLARRKPPSTAVGIVRLNSDIWWRRDSGYGISGFGGLGRDCQMGPQSFADGDGAAVLHPCLGGVMQRRFRLDNQADVVQSPGCQGREDSGGLLGAPGRRVGDDGFGRRRALSLFGPVHHPAGHGGEDLLSGKRQRAHGERNAVTDPALELTHHAAGIIHAVALGSFPHQDGPVVGVIDHRRHCASAKTQGQDLRSGRGTMVKGGNSRRRETGPDIDGENVAH